MVAYLGLAGEEW